MKPNVGLIDRAIRIVAGLAILSLAFVGPQTPWGYIGLVPLVTALVGYCPAYSLFGVRTCALGNGKEDAATGASS